MKSCDFGIIKTIDFSEEKMNNDINQNTQNTEASQNVQAEQTVETVTPDKIIGNSQPTGQIPGKGMAIASLVLGIVSILFSYTLFIGLACGVVGLVLAILAKKKGFVGGMVTAGLVLSIIGTSFSGIYFISCFACSSLAGLGSLY